MKNLNLAVLFIVSTLLISSCKEGDSIIFEEALSEENEINALVEIDNVSDEVNNIIDDVLSESEREPLSNKSGDTKENTNCMTRTVVETDPLRVVELDFGDGCKMPSGNVLKGSLILTYEKNTDDHIVTISYEFVDFYRNDLKVEGENTVIRVRENERGNRQSTLNFNVTLTWPDGEFVSRNGLKVREFIEGFDTDNRQDNVFSITGNWTATFKNGTVLTATIIEPLIRKMTCKYLVSGIIEKNKNNKTFTLDFGDGTCNDKAFITNSNGEVREIKLRHRNS